MSLAVVLATSSTIYPFALCVFGPLAVPANDTDLPERLGEAENLLSALLPLLPLF